MNALRNGIAATARSASLPRLTVLPQFHPEDAERSEAQNLSLGHEREYPAGAAGAADEPKR
jgi:hypothetical protein